MYPSDGVGSDNVTHTEGSEKGVSKDVLLFLEHPSDEYFDQSVFLSVP